MVSKKRAMKEKKRTAIAVRFYFVETQNFASPRFTGNNLCVEM